LQTAPRGRRYVGQHADIDGGLYGSLEGGVVVGDGGRTRTDRVGRDRPLEGDAGCAGGLGERIGGTADSLLSVLLAVARTSHVNGMLHGGPVGLPAEGRITDALGVNDDDDKGSEEDADIEKLHRQSRSLSRMEQHVYGRAGGMQSSRNGIWNGGSCCRFGSVRFVGAAGGRATRASTSAEAGAGRWPLSSFCGEDG